LIDDVAPLSFPEWYLFFERVTFFNLLLFLGDKNFYLYLEKEKSEVIVTFISFPSSAGE